MTDQTKMPQFTSLFDDLITDNHTSAAKPLAVSSNRVICVPSPLMTARPLKMTALVASHQTLMQPQQAHKRKGRQLGDIIRADDHPHTLSAVTFNFTYRGLVR